MLRAFTTVVGSVALVGPLAVGAVAGGVAEAAPTAVSPAGTYDVTIVNLLSDTLTIKANGNFAFAGGPKGTWSETNNLIRMDGTLSTYTYVFWIHQSGENLGSATETGSVKLDGAKWGRWYGIRT
jgi:hypothetical protein